MNDNMSNFKKQIMEAQNSLDKMENEISKARQAGIDVTNQERRASEYRSQILRLRRVYGV